jgi:hypothetical protein
VRRFPPTARDLPRYQAAREPARRLGEILKQGNPFHRIDHPALETRNPDRETPMRETRIAKPRSKQVKLKAES